MSYGFKKEETIAEKGNIIKRADLRTRGPFSTNPIFGQKTDLCTSLACCAD
jgi:hypothetical protein